MKTVSLVIGFVFGLGAYAIFDLRVDYSHSMKLAEANCRIMVLSEPSVELKPSEIDCTHVFEDDHLLTFEVNKTEQMFIDCLPDAGFFRREIAPRNCSLYNR